MDREGDIEVMIVARRNRLTGEEEERGQMIGQNPKAGSSTLFVRGNRDKEYQFLGQRSPWKFMRSHAKTPGKETKIEVLDRR